MKMLETGRWVKIEIDNNWEHLEYTIPGEGLIEIPKTVKTIRVRWPDGTETREKLEREWYSSRYNDMGHEHSVTGEIPAIQVSHFGVRILIRLSRLKAIYLPSSATYKEN